MKVYFYHTQDIQRIWSEYQNGEFPGHFLYGATHLGKHGIDVVLHHSCMITTRWKLSLITAWRILTCKEKYDVLYATHTRGIELIIFLRAMRLYRHPVVVWHHQPIKKADNILRELVAQFFYRGMDRLIFFSRKLVDDSLKSRKARKGRMFIVPWGADLDFYDKLMTDEGTDGRHGFISTGKELRDMPTLIGAFNETECHLDIYIAQRAGDINYTDVLGGIKTMDNVHVTFLNKLDPYNISKLVNKASCVVICCMESDYTVGLTTVVESLALGIPMICSHNPQMPMDIRQSGVGITVGYGDKEGWVHAVEYIATHPQEALDMGRRGRILAEQYYNLEICAERVADLLCEFHKEY